VLSGANADVVPMREFISDEEVFGNSVQSPLETSKKEAVRIIRGVWFA
jgi:hypothetical protein